MSKKFSVSVPTDTRILSITAKDGDPKEAARIANGLRNVAAEKIIAVTKVSDLSLIHIYQLLPMLPFVLPLFAIWFSRDGEENDGIERRGRKKKKDVYKRQSKSRATAKG